MPIQDASTIVVQVPCPTAPGDSGFIGTASSSKVGLTGFQRALSFLCLPSEVACHLKNYMLVGGLEHFLFSHILGC